MRNRILGALILVIATFSSCKNEKSVESLDVVTPQVVDESFKLTVDLIIKKDDDLSLYYTDGSGPAFKEPIWTGIKGSASPQKVTYTIPDENFPSEIRLDFGMKKDQEDIVLKSVLLEYKGKKREIIGGELGTYFRADDNKCTFDPASGIIKAIVKNGEKQNPSLYPQEGILKDEIEKLAK